MDLQQHLIRQMAFSHATFGPGQRCDGIIDHIKKELKEVEEARNKYKDLVKNEFAPDPAELANEWVDVAILALDGLTRTIAYPDDSNDRKDPDIVATMATEMLISKQTKNEARQWPNWRDFGNEAIEHIEEWPDDCFKKGTIVRYENGPTALMRIDEVKINNGRLGHRYYGRQCMGGIVGTFHDNLKLANDTDLKTWREQLCRK